MDNQRTISAEFILQNSIIRQRMPTLDGLRAFAILSVLWHNTTAGQYHGNAILNIIDLLANAGWLGVQLFFVLSGFLITGILLDSTNAPRRFINFYGRRFLRIFPPYYSLLIVICLILPALLPHLQLFHEHLDRSIWYWLFLNNWASPFIGEMPTLPHLWSLAVEEQFYIFWPACIFLLPRRALPWLCASAVLIAAITRFGLTLYDPDFAQEAAYKFTVARWDALTIGALLAFYIRDEGTYQKLRKYWLPVLCGTAVYIILFSAICHNFAPTGAGLTSLNQTISALFFGAIIFYAIQVNAKSAERWQALLMNPILQSVGKYSYAMYLWHMPVILALTPIWHDYTARFSTHHKAWAVTTFSMIVLIGSYSLAKISWLLIEQPFLRLKRFFVTRTVAAT